MANNDLAKRLSSEIHRIHESLSKIEEHHTTHLSEEVFRLVFLPMFAMQENVPANATIQNWIAIAGSPFSTVKIVKDNKVIFEIPPIFSKESVAPSTKDRSSNIGDILSIADKLAARSPIEAQNFINNRLAKTKEDIQRKTDILRHAKEWNVVFDYYGLPPLVALEPTVETGKNDKANSVGEISEFDPI